MPAAVFHTLTGTTPTLRVTASIPTVLDFTLKSKDDAEYFYTQKEIVSGPQTTLEVKLVTTTDSSLDVKYVYIHGYCCTDTNPNTVSASEVTFIHPTNPKKKIGKSYGQQFEPYPESTYQVAFEINLVERQMVLIGIVVLVVFGDGTKKQFLCDPQVGNGPPALYKALVLL